MTAIATWAKALVGIANVVIQHGYGCVVTGSGNDRLEVNWLDTINADHDFTATYLHSGNVCWQYLARRTAPKLVTVW